MRNVLRDPGHVWRFGKEPEELVSRSLRNRPGECYFISTTIRMNWRVREALGMVLR